MNPISKPQRSTVQVIELNLPIGNARQAVVATSFDHADDKLFAHCGAAGDDEIPVKYFVQFDNGLRFNGVFKLTSSGLDTNDRLLRESLRDSIEFASGRRPPSSRRGKEEYFECLAKLGDETVQMCIRILDECLIDPLGN